MAKRILWSAEARADVRAIDRDTALRLLKALDGRFAKFEAEIADLVKSEAGKK